MSNAEFTPNAEELLSANAEYAAGFDESDMPVPPARNLAVVACMDARMDVYAILGLDNGEAHIIRNAGGVITDDVIRSLCLSQRALGTREVVLLHHTQCGLRGINEDAFKAELEEELGVKPTWAVESFTEPAADVLQSITRLQVSPFIPHKDHIRGFVYDVTSGRLNEVTAHTG
jgi:carbonic anhydrase